MKFFLECDHHKNRDRLTTYFYHECSLNPQLRNDFFDAIYQKIDDADIETKTILTEKYIFCLSELFERFWRFDTKIELDDLYLSLHHPEIYSSILMMLDQKIWDHTEKLKEANKKIEQIAQDINIPIHIKYRRKSMMSIKDKMEYLDRHDLTCIEDIIGIRIMILSNEVKDCYRFLEAIHEHFSPNIARFKDYISIPKVNGYQAIHTNILWLYDTDTTGVELQIKTEFMEQRDSTWETAHMLYKHARWKPIQQRTHTEIEMQNERKKHIYIITKDQNIMQIPKSTTVIDLAYIIHTRLGDRVLWAEVNGEFQKPSYKLSEWDSVIVRTHPTKKQENTIWLKIPYLHKKSRKHIYGKS